MMFENRRFLWVFMLFMITIITAKGGNSLKLATTTSTYDSGLLNHIIPPFEKKHNIDVRIISVGTGKAIKLGENGDVDLILVHARSAEDKFVKEGYGVNRHDVMHNDFLILGPEDDPAQIADIQKADIALKRIAASKSEFVSRGDNSGTHAKEKSLWVAAQMSPAGDWYLKVGQGMSVSLRIGDEKNAYILTDRGTFQANRDYLRIIPLLEGDSTLFNPYGVIAVNPKLHPHVEFELATSLIKWLTSPECRRMIGEFKISGKQLFYPNGFDKEQTKIFE